MSVSIPICMYKGKITGWKIKSHFHGVGVINSPFVIENTQMLLEINISIKKYTTNIRINGHTYLRYWVHVFEIRFILCGRIISKCLENKLHIQVLPVTGGMNDVTVDPLPGFILWNESELSSKLCNTLATQLLSKRDLICKILSHYVASAYCIFKTKLSNIHVEIATDKFKKDMNKSHP